MTSPKIAASTGSPPKAKDLTGPQNGGISGRWANVHFGRLDPKAWTQSKAFDAYVREETNDRRIEVPVWTLPPIPTQQVIGGASGGWSAGPANAKGMGTPLLYQSSMAVDSDGGGNEYAKYGDKEGQPSLALSYLQPQGQPVSFPDPTVVPYVVLPQTFYRTHPQVQLGDIVAVMYNPGHPVPDGKGGSKTVYSPQDGKVAYGIYGDQGGDYRTAQGHKKAQIGESSMLLAQQLGINPDPNNGGTPNGVTYIVFPGSAFNKPGTGIDPQQVTAQTIAQRGAKLFAAIGGSPGPLPNPTFDPTPLQKK